MIYLNRILLIVFENLHFKALIVFLLFLLVVFLDFDLYQFNPVYREIKFIHLHLI